MTTVSLFLSKLLVSLMRNYFPKRTSGAALHTLSKVYVAPIGFVSPSFEAVYCYISGLRLVAAARYRVICLVHDQNFAPLSAVQVIVITVTTDNGYIVPVG